MRGHEICFRALAYRRNGGVEMSIEADVNLFMKQLDTAISKVLLTDVSEVAKNALREAVYEEVYAAYTPTVYQRQMDSGGLSDKENMMATVDVATRTLEVEDIRSDEGANVAAKVEDGYRMPNGVWMVPRPFHKPAEDKMMASGEAESALESGLKNLGF